MKNLVLLLSLSLFLGLQAQATQATFDLQKQAMQNAEESSLSLLMADREFIMENHRKPNFEKNVKNESRWWEPVEILVTDSDGKNKSKKTSTYDGQGVILTSLMERWNLDKEMWDSAGRFTYTHNEEGLLATQIEESWSVDKGWLNSAFYVHTYDKKGNLLEALRKSWEGQAWSDASRSVYTYDENGNMLTHTKESKTGEAWVGVNRYTYTYNGQGKNDTAVATYWSATQNAWVNSTRDIYTYDEKGNRYTWIVEIWFGTSWAVNNQWRYTYKYDNQGNKTEWLLESWDWGKDDFANNMRYTYAYDGKGNLLTINWEKWSASASEWSQMLFSTYEYDENGNAVVCDAHDGSFYYNNMKSYYENVEHGNATVKYTEIILVSNENIKESVDFQLYSKGTQLYVEAANLTGASVEVLDVLGRTLCKANFSGSFSVELPKQGVYIVRVMDKNNQNSVRKIGLF